ncbi:MAG: nitronate monooxygenase [Flavobacteriales bacterium]
MKLNDLLGIEHPIIVAPMFLISNVDMVVVACENGATAAFPALNYRTDEELKGAIAEIKRRTKKPFGVNLIVNKSNPKAAHQLALLVEEKVDFIITSLGSPQQTIELCKPHGIKVFCDVTNLEYAQKVEALGADAVIAVTNRAGGHCGSEAPEKLIPHLVKNLSIPVIAAGGVANKQHVDAMMEMGASGVSVGTVFLACKEANISEDYRQALIEYGEKDIVLTTKMSGSHLTVINTPYVQSIGTKATFLERLMNRNKRLKKFIKMLIFIRGMKAIENAASKATYKTVWCAGPSIEYIHSIRPLKEILKDLT